MDVTDKKEDPIEKCKSLVDKSSDHIFNGRLEQAINSYGQILEEIKSSTDQGGITATVNSKVFMPQLESVFHAYVGDAYRLIGDVESARSSLEQAKVITDMSKLRAIVLEKSSLFESQHGDPVLALLEANQSLEIFEESKEYEGRLLARVALGKSHMVLGRNMFNKMHDDDINYSKEGEMHLTSASLNLELAVSDADKVLGMIKEGQLNKDYYTQTNILAAKSEALEALADAYLLQGCEIAGMGDYDAACEVFEDAFKSLGHAMAITEVIGNNRSYALQNIKQAYVSMLLGDDSTCLADYNRFVKGQGADVITSGDISINAYHNTAVHNYLRSKSLIDEGINQTQETRPEEKE